MYFKVGYRRYVLDKWDEGSLDEMKEHEVEEFDPPSEVRCFSFIHASFICGCLVQMPP